MELNGKKIAFLGDSITEGYGATSEEKTYWSILGRETGAEVYGYGIGGTTIARRQKLDEMPKANKYFGSRAGAVVADADAIVIFGGTNDLGSGVSMGTHEDRTDNTFCGAYHNLICLLRNCYPNAKLLVMTPLHRLNEQVETAGKGAAYPAATLAEYVDTVLAVARLEGVSVLDLYRECPINPAIADHQQHYMPDGLHPNDAGHRLVADCLITAMKAL